MQGLLYSVTNWTESWGQVNGLGVVSMNATGELVGTYMRSVEGVGDVPRPFIWLPQAN